MNEKMAKLLVALVCLVSICLTKEVPTKGFFPQRVSGCGFVYDGDTNGKLDIDVQTSTTTVSANWFGFADSRNIILKYEWAIISEKLASPVITMTEAKKRCRETAGFEGEPDVMQWELLDPSVTSVTRKGLLLVPGVKYFVVLRAINTSGRVVVSNSNGFVVEAPESSDNVLYPESGTGDDEQLSKGTEELTEVAPEVNKSTFTTDRRIKRHTEDGSPGATTCSSNLCQRFVGIGAKLTELYGPPIYTRDDNSNILLSVEWVKSESSSGLSGGGIAGVVVGSVVFALLLLLILGLVLFKASSKKSSKFDEAIYTEEVENEDGTSYKQQRLAAHDQVSTTSKVEFPDTTVRRLSMGDARDIDEGAPADQAGKRSHLALETPSSSLRDYRSAKPPGQ